MKLNTFAILLPFFVLATSQASLSPVIEAEDHLDASATALSQALQSQKPSDRIAAAFAYGRIQSPSGIDPLIQLLSDSNPKVLRAAIFNLGQFGWSVAAANGREAEIASHISPFLKNADATLRAEALEAIGKLSSLTGSDLIAASLSDPSADVRARAAKALTRLLEVTQNRGSSVTPPALSAASFQALSASAKDSSAFVRENVAYYFSANSVAGATQTILTLSSDSDLWVRFFATKALGKINDPSVITKLGSLALDSNYIIRVTALQSLTALKAIGSLSPSTMTTLSQDPTFHVRGALAGGLGTLPSSSDLTQAKALLQTFVQDSSSTVRVDAWISLTELNGASELPSLQKALSSDPAWPARVGVVQALSLLGNAGEPLLLQAATDSDVHVRAIAMSALSAIPDAGAFNAIVKGLSSDQISERQSAVDAIAPRSESTVATELWNAYLRSANPTSTKWNGTREEAIGDLLGLPAASQPATPVLTAELEQVLKDPDTNLANFALQKLQALKVPGLPAAAIPALSFSPYRDLNVGNHPKVVLETTRGRVVIEFNTKMAPITVANFVGLSEAKRYDAIPFHRVVSGYIAQGGDPDGTGYGDAGYQMRQETGWATYRRGAVALARTSDVNSDSAQFFITTTPSPKLDSLYTIIGHVVEGMDVVDKLEQGDLINTARLLR